MHAMHANEGACMPCMYMPACRCNACICRCGHASVHIHANGCRCMHVHGMHIPLAGGAHPGAPLGTVNPGPQDIDYIYKYIYIYMSRFIYIYIHIFPAACCLLPIPVILIAVGPHACVRAGEVASMAADNSRGQLHRGQGPPCQARGIYISRHNRWAIANRE